MIKVNCFKFVSLICLVFIICFFFVKKVNASAVYSGAGVKINSNNDEDLTSTEFTYRYAIGGSDTSKDDTDSFHVISSTRN